jgi:hypothetical protein
VVATPALGPPVFLYIVVVVVVVVVVVDVPRRT